MTVLVLGSGIMGNGIGQVAAMAGHEAVVRDVSEEQLARARATVETSLGRFLRKGRITEEEVAATLDRLTFTTDLDAAAGADTVIEAVPESLELKRSVLAEVIPVVAPDALLGTNTSQLSITAIGAELGEDAERLVGVHFFNPPVMMRLVELIRGDATTDETLERARTFAEGLGKEVVVCRKDLPGFITTRAYAALRGECLRMLEDGLASAEDIDRALKLGFNFPMGPLELADFNGLDTVLSVFENLAEAYGERFQEPGTLRRLVDQGRLGRKTGAGIFDYDEAG
jgi:3-hydroxybutyryl-CoA dehydrogenase